MKNEKDQSHNRVRGSWGSNDVATLWFAPFEQRSRQLVHRGNR